jgi:glycosyltransferase involved in cell wall biosynthesis
MPRAVSQTSVALSVVISVREAEETIGRDVRRIADELRAAGVAFEVLAVNDGCRDNSFSVLRLVAAWVPELRLLPGDAAGRAFLRGAAEARGETVALLDARRGGLPVTPIAGVMARLACGVDAVVLRGRCILGRRLPCLPVIVDSRGHGDLYERSFERNARGLVVEIVGVRPRLTGFLAPLLSPVFRLLAA